MKQGGRQTAASGHAGKYPKLPRHPFAAAPIAAALVFAEDEFLVRTPMPIVFMNDDTRFVGKLVDIMRMPAGVALAYDGCGCAESGRHDRHRADRGRGKDFLEHSFLVSIGPLPGLQTP